MNYREWRESILARDNYICQKCFNEKKSSRPLHAHHIKSREEFPELIFDLNNGKTLCSSCHASVHFWIRMKLPYAQQGEEFPFRFQKNIDANNHLIFSQEN